MKRSKKPLILKSIAIWSWKILLSPDTQLFAKIVKESEIISIRRGNFSLTDLNYTELASLIQQIKGNDRKKPIKKLKIKRAEVIQRKKYEKKSSALLHNLHCQNLAKSSKNT